MAKNTPKKNAFFTDADSFEPKGAYTHTDTDTDIVSEPSEAPETKSKRAYLLVKPSVWERLTKYGKAHHRSNNDIINELVERFLDDNNA